MKILFIESAVHTGSVTVHLRNCVEIVKYINENTEHKAILKYSDSPILDFNEQYDIIIYSYGSFYFDIKKYMKLIENQKNLKMGWITNEYDVGPNSSLKKHMSFVISNFVQNLSVVKVPVQKYLMTNLNTLMFKGVQPKTKKLYDVIYYGTYRENREPYFRKYIQEPLILSTSSKNHKLFKSIGCRTKVMDKLCWEAGRETLNAFKSILYIEDTVTHDNYNHLANRFYEGLTHNCGVFFDQSCMNTIKKSQYPIDNFWIVNSLDEIVKKANSKDFETHRNSFVEANLKQVVDERLLTLQKTVSFLESI